MLLAKIISSVNISLLVSLFYVSVANGNTLAGQQEAFLLELANESITESFHVLAVFYEKKAGQQGEFTSESIHWRIKAAQSGHVSSLYRLAYYGLNFNQYKNLLSNTYKSKSDAEKEWRNEGLVLISEAAILGQKYAGLDLVLLPKMFDYTYEEITLAVNEALERLTKGMLLNCQFFVCQDSPASDVNTLARYNNAVSQFNQKISNLACHKIIFCLELMIEKVRVIDKSMFDKFQAKSRYKNLSKIKKNKRLQDEENVIPDWESGARIDRNKNRFSAAKKIIDHHAVEDMEKIEKKIKELLEKINYHRHADNKIQFSDVMEILAQP